MKTTKEKDDELQTMTIALDALWQEKDKMHDLLAEIKNSSDAAVKVYFITTLVLYLTIFCRKQRTRR